MKYAVFSELKKSTFILDILLVLQIDSIIIIIAVKNLLLKYTFCLRYICRV
jgi:hypothetical protein